MKVLKYQRKKSFVRIFFLSSLMLTFFIFSQLHSEALGQEYTKYYFTVYKDLSVPVYRGAKTVKGYSSWYNTMSSKDYFRVKFYDEDNKLQKQVGLTNPFMIYKHQGLNNINNGRFEGVVLPVKQAFISIRVNNKKLYKYAKFLCRDVTGVFVSCGEVVLY